MLKYIFIVILTTSSIKIYGRREVELIKEVNIILVKFK